MRIIWFRIFILVVLILSWSQAFDVHRPIDTPYDLDTLTDPSMLFPLANIIPVPRVHHSLVMNTKFLVVYGGYSSNGTILGDTNLYHISTQKWSGPINKEECCNDQTEIVDVIGSTREFNFPFLKSGHEGDYPLPRAEHAACVVKDWMYIFGGITSDYSYMNDLYAFDTDNLQWLPIYSTGGVDSTPRRRAGHTILSYNNQFIFLFGGRASTNGRTVPLNDLWKFDVASREWERADSLSLSKPDGRHYMGSAVLKDHIYIFSGSEPDSNLLYNDLWSFSIRTGIWTQLYSGSFKVNYEFAPPPLVYSHLIPVSTSTSDGLLVYGGLGSGGICVGTDNNCRQNQVSFGQVYLYSLSGEEWLQPFQENNYEIEQTTLSSHWQFARLTNGSKDLYDPSNTRHAKMTKSYAMEKIVTHPARKSFYEFGGVRVIDASLQSNNQEVWETFPQSQDVGGFSESAFTDTESGEQLRNRVTTPVNAMWTFTSQYTKTANLSFDNILRLYTVSTTDVVLLSEYFPKN